MDASIVTALAALGGSLLGGLTTFASTWLSHRYEQRRERISLEITKRETLYGNFIDEATRLEMDAFEHDVVSLSSTSQLLSLLNRIRLIASDEVVETAEAAVDQIARIYMADNKTLRELYADRQQSEKSQSIFNSFGQACRKELQMWK